MVKRPFAYVCSPFAGDTRRNAELARQYSRAVYEAGYTPITPHLLFPQFLDDRVPEERQAGLHMAQLLLRRCHVLIVCGDTISEGMTAEILLALRLRITATTLDGIQAISEFTTEQPRCHC